MLKVSTFCSGIGSPEQALKNLGIEHKTVFACEIDKYARQSYLANHECETMYHDMTKEDYVGEHWYSDINISGIPCFKAGTLITTSNGLKNIEDIQTGDLVLTHKNRFRKVVIPMVKESKSFLDIKIQGSPLISATEEHPFYVREMSRKWNNERRCDERLFSEPKWVDAKDLTKNHFVGFGMNNESVNSYELTEEECWYLGRYMADGYSTSRGKRENGKERKLYKTTLCVGAQKTDSLYDFKEIKTTPTKERTVFKYHTYNKRLHTLCSFIGRGAENKEIPTFILNLPVYLLKIFIEGYLSGDGSEKEGKYSATTVSRKLAYSLCQAVFKCYNTPCSITFTKRPPTCIIEGRTVNQKDTYRVQFCKEARKQNNSVYLDGVVWQPVRDVTERVHNDFVYNFEVEEDNSYVAENCIVHNCQAFSLAGKRLGELDPRGLLFFDFYRYVKNQRPKYFIIENVKGLLSDNDGNTFRNWINLLGQSENGNGFFFPHEDSLMYNLHWTVLNSKDYGVPQNRERVFLVGIRNDLPNDFVFPKGIPLTKRLKDVLEYEVDEKYFLSEKLIQGFISHTEKHKAKGNGFEFKPTDGNCISKAITTRAGTRVDDNYLKVPSATKSGYEVATDGDSINLEHPNSETRRGRVGVAQTLTTSCNQAVYIGAIRGRNPDNPNDRTTGAEMQQTLEINHKGTSNCLTSVQKDNVVVYGNLKGGKWDKTHEQSGRVYNPLGIAPTIHTMQGGNQEPKIIQLNQSLESGGKQPYQQNRVYDSKGIIPSLCRGKSDLNIRESTYRIRKLTPKECFRLQGFSDEFYEKAVKAGVSSSQLYKQAGNSITVNVMQSILKNLLKNELS